MNDFLKKITSLTFVALISLGGLTLTGCEDDNAIEEAAEEVEDAAD